jgi:hypothetical protein
LLCGVFIPFRDFGDTTRATQDPQAIGCDANSPDLALLQIGPYAG